ncbi:primase-helicase family protein [Rhodoplanes sp. Z2-YC6860]|uniref:primase-helicase family protein n=1 Tax=Rhodoplanes sp. Z2-YC6860 TaxID=674703 RepID=UPI00078DB2CF|nr:primase-helicase family protein [Rhodoplanes sp. Z2-YC6860]AMN40182.1 integrase [Rhodoplanes sp. Z2-YC6860]
MNQLIPHDTTVDQTLLPTGDERLDKMNARYFVVREGGKAFVGTFEQDRERWSLVLMRFSDFKSLYMHQRIIAGDRSQQLGTWWLNNPKRRQYAGLTFQPDNCARVIDQKLNLWRGWQFEPRQGDWSKLREHIWIVVASRNTEVFDYILNWLAWCVQHPNRRAEVVLVMQGKRGTGKGTVGNAMCELFGQHALQISSAEHLVGRFNGHLRDTVLLFADEAYWPGNKGAEGTIKRLVTEPTIFIEAKGRDGIEVPNLLHVIMASNEDWVVPAGERERRYFVVKVNDEHLQDHAWFNAINKQLENGGYQAMLHDLLLRKIGDFHPRQLPKANDLTDQQARSLDPLDGWWAELLETGVLVGSDPNEPNRAVSNKFEQKVSNVSGDRVIIRPGLYDQARSIEPRLRAYNDHKLGAYLTQQSCDNSRKVMRHRGWTFPDLTEAREKWVERFPGWKWRNPNLTEWQHEISDDPSEMAPMDNPDDVPF